MKLVEVFRSEDDPRLPGHIMFFYSVDVAGEIRNDDAAENSAIGWLDPQGEIAVGWKWHVHVLKLIREARWSGVHSLGA